MITFQTLRSLAICLMSLSFLFAAGCDLEERAADSQKGEQGKSGSITPRQMVDALHTVLDVDRAVYSKLIVNRLAVEEKVIKASEHWSEEKALVLPAQMFRAGAEMAMERGVEFSYGLLSAWPINQKNRARTDLEIRGLQFLEDNPGQNFYGEETLGGVTYYCGMYPDVAIAEACVSCHNQHPDSPKTDFKIGDLVGGMIVRVPM